MSGEYISGNYDLAKAEADKVDAQIIEIKEDDGKVSLSIKALLTPPELPAEEAAEDEGAVTEDMPMSVGTETEATPFEVALEEATDAE